MMGTNWTAVSRPNGINLTQEHQKANLASESAAAPVELRVMDV